MISVAPADPRASGPRALLEASHALMDGLFREEDNHYLPIDALTGPDIRFFAAMSGAETVGTGGLAVREGYGEIKSMFTARAARGRGVGALILGAIEAEARALHLPALKLETGDRLVAAYRLYVRAGFAPCGPFGAYSANGTSLFMEKSLGGT